MPDLILRPSGLGDAYALQLRYHDCIGPVEYHTLARVSEVMAREIIAAGQAYWLFGDPAEKSS